MSWDWLEWLLGLIIGKEVVKTGEEQNDEEDDRDEEEFCR